jgi:DNA-binding MarR family transcriptional regulator
VELGYMHHQRSEIDRRSVRVRLTDKGRHVRGLLSELFARHAEAIERRNLIDTSAMDDINTALRRMERFWGDQIRYIY